MAGRSARTLRSEDEISRYRIVGPLGAGGMGEVYLAQDRSLERNVALKILPPELVRSEERVRRFVLEAKSASSLSHPNIVTIYEIGQDAVRSPGEPDSGPVHYISMELVSGRTLSALIHDEKTDLRTLLGYLAQAADGLAKAHAAGIVHRDLKPGNVMVTADGFAKVLDFGLAKLTERREAGADASMAPTMAEATQEGVVMGTAGYMSPEQVQGKAVDHRSDIFSFGCMLYEAATRQRPFSAGSDVETMHRILHDKPVPVEEIAPAVPAEVRRLIRRCLAKSPDQRLQSMKDLAIELREIVDEYDTMSASASSGHSASTALPQALPPSRSRVPALAWIAGAVVVVAALAFAGWALMSRPRPDAFQTMRTSAQTSRGDVTETALSPDGRYLAYIAGRPGSLTLRVRQVATGSDVEILPASDTQIRNPSFSPDGDYLFYTAVRPDRQNYLALFQVASLGGNPRERAFDVDSRVSFSPDGRQLVFWRNVLDPPEQRLVLLELASGEERVLATVKDQDRVIGAPAWSPDGRRIAALLLRPAPNLEGAITMFDPATGRRRDFLKRPLTLFTGVEWMRDGKALVSCGQDLSTALMDQVFLHTFPDARTTRVTNDFNLFNSVSASRVDETIAAVRTTRVINVWAADAAGGPARRLTSITNPENSAFGLAGLDSATALFTAPDDRFLHLWRVGIGETPRPITSGGAHVVNMRAAAGVAVFDRIDSAGVHVWRLGADGRTHQITTGAGEQIVQLSRDGRHVVVSHFDAPLKHSMVSIADGRVVMERVDAIGCLGFSHDSRHVLFGRTERDAQGLSRTVWSAHPVAGGEPTANFLLPNRSGTVRWAPDGRAVTFRNLADPAWNVYRMPFDGSAPTPVTRFTTGRITDYSWSPDGSKLAARVDEGVASNLWVVAADGSGPTRMTSFTTERAFAHDWLPDSRGVVLGAGTVTTDAVLIRELR